MKNVMRTQTADTRIKCAVLVDNKDYLPSLGGMSPDDQLTVSKVCMTHFKNRSWQSISQPSTDDRPIVDIW